MNRHRSSHAPLPLGYVLDTYQIHGVLGKPGGFGVTYAAFNLETGEKVAIKELFPSEFVARDQADQVVVLTAADAMMFSETMGMFRREAEILSQVNHNNVVRVLDYLETNGTAYIVMRYEEGYDLGRHLEIQLPHRLNENELRKLLMPLLDGLEEVHNLNFLHLDIKPSNIYLTRGHNPVLLDFGSAMMKPDKTVALDFIIASRGYTPFEQYSSTSRLGPYTDIHALGMVLYHAMLSGEDIPAATDRMNVDTVHILSSKLAGQEYSQTFLQAVDWAIKIFPQDRPQSVAEWRQAFVLTPQDLFPAPPLQPPPLPAPPNPPARPERKPSSQPVHATQRPPKDHRWLWYVLGFVGGALLLCVLFAVLLLVMFG